MVTINRDGSVLFVSKHIAKKLLLYDSILKLPKL